MGGAEDHYTQHGDYTKHSVDLWENDAPAFGR
jgi:hypothetical protein